MIHWEALFYNILSWEPICYKNRAFFLLFFYIELRLKQSSAYHSWLFATVPKYMLDPDSSFGDFLIIDFEFRIQFTASFGF